jgi:hypothetical protein
MLIGLVGLKNSGKDTVAKTLIYEYSFNRDSFANPLKDAVAAIFGYDRKMLEGNTKASREWREQVDPVWTELLGRSVSPRQILQELGTEVFRDNFNKDIWVNSFIIKRLTMKDSDIVISDVRFKNEMEAIKKLGGKLVRIKRGSDPEYISNAVINKSIPQDGSVHRSELDWALNYNLVDYVIDNDGDLLDLQYATRRLMSHFGKTNGYKLGINTEFAEDFSKNI